jgi:hypothetical protein
MLRPALRHLALAATYTLRDRFGASVVILRSNAQHTHKPTSPWRKPSNSAAEKAHIYADHALENHSPKTRPVNPIFDGIGKQQA